MDSENELQHKSKIETLHAEWKIEKSVIDFKLPMEIKIAEHTYRESLMRQTFVFLWLNRDKEQCIEGIIVVQVHF